MSEKVKVPGSCKGGINCLCNRNRKSWLKRVASKAARKVARKAEKATD